MEVSFRSRAGTGGSSDRPLAQVLYRLVHENPSWLAEDLAEAAGISAAEVESTLDSLEAISLLVPSTENPGGYVAIDPDAALSRLFAAEERQVSRHQEQLARTRDSIRAIMGDFMNLRSDGRDVVEIETLRSVSQVNAFLDDAVSLVKSRECTMHPGGIPPVELMDDMLLRDSEVMSRGIKVRTLYAQHIAEVPYMGEYLESASQLGMEIRLAAHLPLRMLLFDVSLALLPIDPQDSSQGAFAIRGIELVRSLQALFDFCWHNAAPLEQRSQNSRSQNPHSEIEITVQEQLIIRMLAAGMKDESIARQLGVSARTLSRTISAFLDRLGVGTRFQAALKVADLGLLDTQDTLTAPPSSSTPWTAES
ncbi:MULTISPECIES: LuxR family transcriptional regulator [unclassified Streptomyces]|uniref:helix-turn-helix transcriptional regulator n=1 Tax=unclassified Streptomyces TaxID=2593676 RepID=UPI00224D01B6|nr:MULTISPECIES: LuxR family transcriptional regulator [unclassified Streptomyces]WSC22606.1 LuxR C-terminal-related transcriptional regulator [Streptomyces sp. NBC_01766]